MSAHEISSNKESFSEEHELRLVKLRNPWGHTEFKWDHSDEDLAFWTPAMKKELNHSPNSKDGVFFMNFEDYLHLFDHTCISIDFKDKYIKKSLIYDGN